MSLRPEVHDLGGPVCYFSRAGVMPDRRGLGLQRSAIRVRERWARARGAVAAMGGGLAGALAGAGTYGAARAATRPGAPAEAPEQETA